MNGERRPDPAWAVERALLGGLILAPDRLADVAELRPEHFHRPQHGALLRLLRRLDGDGRGYSLSEVLDEVMSHDDAFVGLDGPVAYVSRLPDVAEVSAIESQARRIIAASHRRTLRDRLTRAVARLDRADDLVEVMRDVDAASIEMHTARVDDVGFELYGDIADRECQSYLQDDAPPAISTGYTDLDAKMNGGLRPGQLIIIAGRPAMGKSAFALNLALRVAAAGHGVAAYSAEMARDAVARRLLCADGQVNVSALRSHRLDPDGDWRRFTAAVERAQGMPLAIDDRPGRTLPEIGARLRRLSFPGGARPRVLIVDYLQLLRPDASATAREVQVAGIARGLKELALGFPDLTVIALSQLNRSVESRSDKRPGMSDLRESGEIEQAADVVALLYRDEVYNPDSADKGIAEVILAKQRDGLTGTVRLAWLGDRQRFDSLAEDFQREPRARPYVAGSRRGWGGED